jgi:hypothetical protein
MGRGSGLITKRYLPAAFPPRAAERRAERSLVFLLTCRVTGPLLGLLSLVPERIHSADLHLVEVLLLHVEAAHLLAQSGPLDVLLHHWHQAGEGGRKVRDRAEERREETLTLWECDRRPSTCPLERSLICGG